KVKLNVFDRTARKDRDAVVRFLAGKGAIVARGFEFQLRKILIDDLRFLQANDVRLCCVEPRKKLRHTHVDRVYVPGCDLHQMRRGRLYFSVRSIIRRSATFAHFFVSGSTTISFTTLPAARFSIAQARFCGAMRNIVAHIQRSGASRRMCLSGKRFSRRLTRFTSVPIAHAEPAGDSSTDRKSTRLNSSHVKISYAVFCL